MDEGRAGVDDQPPAQGPPPLPAPAHADLGRRHVRDRLRRHLLLHQAHRQAGQRLGPAARVGQGHLRQARDPRGRAQVPGRRDRPVRERGRLPPNREDLEAQGVLFCDMDTALREYPELVKQYFGTVIPANDNKFAALNTAAWSGGSFIYVPPGRQGRHAAAGLLPDQRRKHGPVRAHADHRRRGRPGALHRGLLGAGVHHRLAALGRGRDHLQALEPGHLHHHPELVQQRLQPGHQAGPLRGRGPHGVDRRQHRQPPDHEVPGRLPHGPQGLGRGALGGLRRRRPAPGRRGQDGPRRPGDHLDHHLQVDLQGRRPDLLPGPGPLRGGGPPVEELRALRRPAARRPVAGATPTRTSSSASRTPRWATRPRCPRSATTSSST